MRQRLERRDTLEAASDVIHPIVYTIDSTVPRQWVPWITRGILAWEPAFEQIGFGHAIVVWDSAAGRLAPPGAEAMPGCRVTWTPVPRDGAMTNVVSDTMGDITQCVIALNAGLIPMLQRFAYLYLGATHPAMRYPFSDTLSGRFLQIAVEHEAGHSLGFADYPKGGVGYPTDSLHVARFLHRVGHTTSIMGYTFFDFVAQPEDHIPFDDLLAHIGAWDVWALGWAYHPVPGARTSEEERPVLDRWRAVQDTAFGLRATTSMPNSGFDSYLLGSDLVASAEAVIRNLARTVPRIDTVLAPFGTDSAQTIAAALRHDVLNGWPAYLTAAGDLVGAKIAQPPYARDSARLRTVPIDSARQVRALHFVLRHLLYGQDPLVQAVFGRAPQDTSLMLFPSEGQGWPASAWRAVQVRVLQHLLAHWLPGVVEQASETRVLPVWCHALGRVHRALQQASENASDPAGAWQALTLNAQLTPVLDPATGVCPGA
jgi:hypothetical protein